MLTKADLTSMGYYNIDDYLEGQNTSLRTYSEWVESMMLTTGRDRLVENILGLVGEAGEVAEKIKKLIRDSSRFSNKDIAKELGDVLFYTVALGNLYGFSLQDIVELNREKLDSRKERGTLHGSGDNR
jgi:NTP pyrophosphatase (non-canonical NTP hydrolase)